MQVRDPLRRVSVGALLAARGPTPPARPLRNLAVAILAHAAAMERLVIFIAFAPLILLVIAAEWHKPLPDYCKPRP